MAGLRPHAPFAAYRTDLLTVRSPPPARAGFTLVELVATLAILGVLAALAAPRLGPSLRRVQMEWALNQLSRDIFYARMVAVRAARRVEVRFTSAEGDPCIAEYRIVVREDPEREVKRVRLAGAGPGPCLRRNGPNPLFFNSRGRPNWNYSFWMREGAMLDSMTMTQLGRLQRWP